MPRAKPYANVPKPERAAYDRSVNERFYARNPQLTPEPYAGIKARRAAMRRTGAR